MTWCFCCGKATGGEGRSEIIEIEEDTGGMNEEVLSPGGDRPRPDEGVDPSAAEVEAKDVSVTPSAGGEQADADGEGPQEASDQMNKDLQTEVPKAKEERDLTTRSITRQHGDSGLMLVYSPKMNGGKLERVFSPTLVPNVIAICRCPEFAGKRASPVLIADKLGGSMNKIGAGILSYMATCLKKPDAEIEFLPIFNVQMPRELVIVLHYFDGTTEQLLPPATVDFDGLANQGKAVDAAAIIVNHNQCFRSSNIGLVQFMTAGRANGAALTF